MAGCKYEKFLSPGGKVLSSRSSAVRLKLFTNVVFALWLIFLLRHMLANKFSNSAVMKMIEGLVKDGFASSKFLPEGWRVR